MKIKYKGVIYEATQNDKGHIVSSDGRLFFGVSIDKLMKCELVKNEG